jgi:multimeric flavodoxin WrbA
MNIMESSTISGEVLMNNNLLIFKGSPRENGNSSLLANKAAEGAKEVGAEVESFSLHRLDIHPCDGCDICQETGVCVLKDDMQPLYARLRALEAILIASPVYWFTMNAQTKLFIDRWYALQGTQGNVLKGKKFGVILTYGDSDPYTSGAINAIRTFQDMFHFLKADLVGMVYGTANDEGDVLKQPELLDQAYKLGKKLAVIA